MSLPNRGLARSPAERREELGEQFMKREPALPNRGLARSPAERREELGEQFMKREPALPNRGLARSPAERRTAGGEAGWCEPVAIACGGCGLLAAISLPA
jgi:hypothetical protein